MQYFKNRYKLGEHLEIQVKEPSLGSRSIYFCPDGNGRSKDTTGKSVDTTDKVVEFEIESEPRPVGDGFDEYLEIITKKPLEKIVKEKVEE